MGKRSGGTRGTNSNDSSNSRNVIAQTEISENSKKLQESLKKTFSNWTKQELEDVLDDSGHVMYNEFWRLFEGKPIFGSEENDSVIRKYVNGKYGADDDLRAELSKIVHNENSVRGTLYRGELIKNNNDIAKKRLALLKKGKTFSLNDLANRGEYLSTSVEKLRKYTHEEGSKEYDFNTKKMVYDGIGVNYTIKGKIKGLDISVTNEREFIADGRTKVRVSKVIFDKKKNVYNVELRTI